jgi:LuxR family transcriptional regulator, maltose regulon positive regulatory protein
MSGTPDALRARVGEHGMMTDLLTTKLHIPPLRPSLVPRPRLIAQLDEGLRLGRKLTLISAPAGFGKSTLLSEWLSGRGSVTQSLPVAWLSLDERDNDLVRFLTYFSRFVHFYGGFPELTASSV